MRVSGALAVAALSAALAACDPGDDGLPPDGTASPAVDAAVDAASGDDVDLMWTTALPTTRVLNSIVVVEGGALVVAIPELYFVGDDGALVERLTLPDDFSELTHLQVAPGNDVLLGFGRQFVRYATPSLDQRWAWSSAPLDHHYVAATEEGAIVLRQVELEESWTALEIDATGQASVERPVEGLDGIFGGGVMWPAADGRLQAFGSRQRKYLRWVYDAVDAVAQVDVAPVIEDDVGLIAGFITSGVYLGKVATNEMEPSHYLFGYDAAGAPFLPVVAASPFLGYGNSAIVGGDILSLSTGSLYRAALAEPEVVQQQTLRPRPGTTVDKSVLRGHADGRVFAAWIDQGSTFDVELHIGRLY